MKRMKLRFALGLLLAIPFPAAFAAEGSSAVTKAPTANKIHWHSSYRKAFDEATEQGKPILVQISADWCGYCHQMINHTYTNSSLVAQINRSYVPLMLDADAHPDLVRAFRASSLPTTLIVSTDLKILSRSSGYQSATVLASTLTKWQGSEPKSDQPLTADTETPPVADMTDMSAAALAPAFNQYCLVSMLEDGKLVAGSSEFSVEHNGLLVCFASAEHRERFLAAPETFWPVAGGSCPVTNQEDHAEAAGDPEYAVVYRGRLWFFSDSEHQQRFISNPVEYATSQL